MVKNDSKTSYISAYVGRRLDNLILEYNIFLIFINRIIFLKGEPMFTEKWALGLQKQIYLQI